MSQTRFGIRTGIALLVVLAWAGASRAQQSPLPSSAVQPAPSPQQTINTAAAPCVQPPPLISLQDYDGPLRKTVGLFAQRLERKAVHPPHYKPGDLLCSLGLKDKFVLFVRDAFDPATFFNAGFNAGIGQAVNQDPTFGQGAAGYGRRFGTDFADQVSFEFFKDFAYPSIFSEDPRYYRLIHGSGGRRLLHALEHSVVAHSDHGNTMFNYSEWLGTASTVTLGNLYHPGNQRGFAPAAEWVGYYILIDAGFDTLREFWPEISRKFRLPFRAEPEPDELDSNPAAR